MYLLMNRPNKYSSKDKMSDIICSNYTLLQVFSRFEIPLGFGDRTTEEICRENNIDCHTFLTIIDFMDSNAPCQFECPDIHLPTLLKYLEQAHTYFLDFNLPMIRRKLIEALDYTENNDVNMLILQFFDQYADEVRRHMEYENRYVFSYVEAILGNSEPTSSFSMTTFASRHKQLDGHHIEAKLTELKNIIIKYYPAKAYNNLLNSVLFDIFSCEKELAMHCLLEDFLLVPAVLRFEKENRR